MAALCPAIMNISAAMDPPAPAAAPLASLAQLAFLLLLMRCFWIGSVLTAGMIQPTPAVLLAVQLLTVAATTGSAAASCSSQFMQHPLTAGRVDALYSWLEPGIALAQPLLLLTAAGRRAEGAAWRCMSGGRSAPLPGSACTCFAFIMGGNVWTPGFGSLHVGAAHPATSLTATPLPGPCLFPCPQSTWASLPGVHCWQPQQSSPCSCVTTGS